MNNDPRPTPPEQPLPSECCDSGCSPCVWDLYSEELAHYRQELADWQARHPVIFPRDACFDFLENPP